MWVNTCDGVDIVIKTDYIKNIKTNKKIKKVKL